MSTVYFGSPSGTVALPGTEHAWLWRLARDFTAGTLAVRSRDSRERMEELTGIEARGDFAAFQQWAIAVENRFTSHVSPGITWRGQPLNMTAFIANTAIAAGSDPVRLAVRLIEQCDDHAWVEGPDRAWLAAIISQGLDAGVFRGRVLNHGDGPLFMPAGWQDVSALLLARDDEPVVLSHSGSGEFPAQAAGWQPAHDGDDLTGQCWQELEIADRWRIAMDALRIERPWQRLDPAAWHNYRFVHSLSVLDLLADDYIERLDEAPSGPSSRDGGTHGRD